MGGEAFVPKSFIQWNVTRVLWWPGKSGYSITVFSVVKIPSVSLVKSVRLTDGVYYEGNIDDLLKGHYLDLANAGSVRECQRLMFIFFHSPTIWNRSLLLWFLVKALCHPGRTLSFWFSSWPFSWLKERKGERAVWGEENGNIHWSYWDISVDQCSIPAYHLS